MNQQNRQARKQPNTSALAAYLMPLLLFLIACGVCGGGDEDGDQGCSAFKGNTKEGKFDVRTIGFEGKLKNPNKLIVGVGFTKELHIYRNSVAKADDRVPAIHSATIDPPNTATVEFKDGESGVLILTGKEAGRSTLSITGLQSEKQTVEVTDSIELKVKEATQARLTACRDNAVYVRGYPGPFKHSILSGYSKLYGHAPFKPAVTPKTAGTVELTMTPNAYSTFSPSAKAPAKATISLGKELKTPGELEVEIIDIEQIDELRLELVRPRSTMHADEVYAVVLVAYSKGRAACTYGKALLTVKTPNICKLRYNNATYEKLHMDGSVSSDLAVQMLAKGACSIAATLVIGELTLELAEGGLEMAVEESLHVPTSGGGGWD